MMKFRVVIIIYLIFLYNVFSVVVILREIMIGFIDEVWREKYRERFNF